MKVQGRGILIKPDENPEKTKGGIINPIVKEQPNTGLVVQVGDGCEICTAGDRIQYKRKGASIIYLEDVEHHFIIEEQIFFNHGK